MKDTTTTIDDLARMINEGFKTTATKEDTRAVNTRFDSVESRLDHLDARVGRIETDVHALRDEMVHRLEFPHSIDFSGKALSPSRGS